MPSSGHQLHFSQRCFPFSQIHSRSRPHFRHLPVYSPSRKAARCASSCSFSFLISSANPIPFSLPSGTLNRSAVIMRFCFSAFRAAPELSIRSTIPAFLLVVFLHIVDDDRYHRFVQFLQAICIFHLQLQL